MRAHLYAVEFGVGGAIKVGRSTDAPARIGTHVRAAIAAGNSVSRLCVEPCAAPVPAEAKLVGPDGTLYAHATTTCLVFELK